MVLESSLSSLELMMRNARLRIGGSNPDTIAIMWKHGDEVSTLYLGEFASFIQMLEKVKLTLLEKGNPHAYGENKE